MNFSSAFSQNSNTGLIEQGNINLDDRPTVKNKDGTISTVKSFSFGTEKGEILVPLVSDDGRILTEADAREQYFKTGRHLGIFSDPKSATKYAQQLHKDQEAQYAPEPQEKDMPQQSEKEATFARLVQKILGEQEAEGYDPVTGEPTPRMDNGTPAPMARTPDPDFRMSDALMPPNGLPPPRTNEQYQATAESDFAKQVMSNEQISQAMDPLAAQQMALPEGADMETGEEEIDMSDEVDEDGNLIMPWKRW